MGNMSSVLSLSVGSKTVILSNEGLSQHQIMGSLQGAVKILCRLLDHFLKHDQGEQKCPSEDQNIKPVHWVVEKQLHNREKRKEKSKMKT